jgi:hypothetical protein
MLKARGFKGRVGKDGAPGKAFLAEMVAEAWNPMLLVL